MVSVSVMVSNNFFSWVFQFGNRMRIVAPSGVVQEMKTLLAEALEAYE